jgi:hypothetical protein
MLVRRTRYLREASTNLAPLADELISSKFAERNHLPLDAVAPRQWPAFAATISPQRLRNEKLYSLEAIDEYFDRAWLGDD